MAEKVTIPALHQMKHDEIKIVGMVAWDVQMAQIVDRAGVDIVSVGDTIGVNLWGHASPHEVTLDEMILVGKAVRRGVSRALMSIDFPSGILEQGVEASVQAAKRVVEETGGAVAEVAHGDDSTGAVGDAVVGAIALDQVTRAAGQRRR